MGEGAFSNVYRAHFIPTGEIIALKILKDEKATNHVIELTIQEATLLNKMDHRNVIKVKHLIKLNHKYYMGMELLAGQSLQTFMKKKFKNG